MTTRLKMTQFNLYNFINNHKAFKSQADIDKFLSGNNPFTEVIKFETKQRNFFYERNPWLSQLKVTLDEIVEENLVDAYCSHIDNYLDYEDYMKNTDVELDIIHNLHHDLKFEKEK